MRLFDEKAKTTLVHGRGALRYMQKGHGFAADKSYLGPCNKQGEMKAIKAPKAKPAAKTQAAPKAATIDATDSAIALATENDVSLGDVTGTGSEGRIIKADVEKFIASQGD